MPDARYYNGDDERDTLTQAKDTPAKFAPSCRCCGFVVYKIGARLASGGVLCCRCAGESETGAEEERTFDEQLGSVCDEREQMAVAQRLKR